MTATHDSTWRGLDEDAARETIATVVRRQVHVDGHAEIHLAVTAPERRRQLWIRMSEVRDGDISDLPRWRGCRIGLRHGSERPHPRTFLVIEQGEGSPREVFESLIGYACDAIAVAPPDQRTLDALRDALDQWKIFFEENGLDTLGREAQQGLYGELWLLREQLIPRMGAAAAVQSWTGARRTNHDFQNAGHAVEVKTTSARKNHVMRITSERQLDTTGVQSLHVIYITIAHLDQGGETLPQIVASLRKLLRAQPRAAHGFEERLLAAKYADAHAPCYTAGYACRDAKGYEVRDGFPRILERDVPEGVADVAYSVAVLACEPFRVTLEQALGSLVQPTLIVKP